MRQLIIKSKKDMKRIVLTLLSIVICFGANAQSFDKMEREAIKKIHEKPEKLARKQAKKDSRAGWSIAPAQIPLEKQYDTYYKMLYMEDKKGLPYYITGEAMSVGGGYDAALLTATTLAKSDLAGKIQTEIAGLIEVSLSNEQISPDDAVSLSRVVSESKNLIAARLTNVRQPVITHRRTSENAVEVRTVVVYSHDEAKAAAKDAIKKGLEQAGKELRTDLDKLLGFDENEKE